MDELIKKVADALETPWVVHWNTEHAARGRPFGARCCLEMASEVSIEALKNRIKEDKNILDRLAES